MLASEVVSNYVNAGYLGQLTAASLCLVKHGSVFMCLCVRRFIYEVAVNLASGVFLFCVVRFTSCFVPSFSVVSSVQPVLKVVALALAAVCYELSELL